MNNKQLDEILANVYGDSPDYTNWVINKYKEYYDLPIIRKTTEVVPRLFQFYERGKYFLVIAIANQANEILIIKDTQVFGSDVDWRLVGGFIHNGEMVETACERFVENYIALPIDSIEPIAVVENTFTCHDRTLSHIGLAFLALTHSMPSSVSSHKSVFVSSCPEQLAYSNQEVLRYSFEKLAHHMAFIPYDEIETNQRYNFMRFLHNKIVSRVIERYSSRRIKDKILEYCMGAMSIIDVACGDDTLILDLAKHASFCVANDISWNLLNQLRRKTATRNVIFTNHNALELPFRKQFDVVICKNVLHHVHNIDEFVSLTQSIKNVGRRLILVDIENPRKSSLRARLWNDYYRCLLGDLGNYFLTREEFRDALSCVYGSQDIAFDTISTIKGDYMVAVVDF